MIGTLEKEDLLKALGEDVDKIKASKQESPSISIQELTQIVSHNAQVAQQVTGNLATEITMTNIVLKNLMTKLGVDMQEVIDASTQELERLSKQAQPEPASDHPDEATIFGGS